jgi:hypothetical protein
MFQGNDRFEGFCIDLINQLAEMYKFNFTIYKVADNKYGTPNEKGEWNGLVGDLINGVNKNSKLIFKLIIL